MSRILFIFEILFTLTTVYVQFLPKINVNSSILRGPVILKGVPTKGQSLHLVIANPLNEECVRTLSYQWLRDGLIITKGVETSYILTNDDSTRNISVKVSCAVGEAPVKHISSTSVYVVDGGPGTFIDDNQNLGSEVTSSITLGNIDNDGDLDMVVANAGNTGTPNTVWVNNGLGKFNNIGDQKLGNSYSSDIALGDGDGDLDIVFGNSKLDDGAKNKIYKNDGSGTFKDSGQSFRRSDTLGISLGDIDNDGDIDLVEANYNASNKVYLNDGTGNFYNSSNNLGNSLSKDVTLGDLDGDGNLDMIVTNSFTANIVYDNNGSGVFTDSGQKLGAADSRGVALGDIDADGDIHMIVANVAIEANRVGTKIWKNNGNGAFVESGQFMGTTNARDAIFGDIDKDGDLDVIVGNFGSNKIYFNHTYDEK